MVVKSHVHTCTEIKKQRDGGNTEILRKYLGEKGRIDFHFSEQSPTKRSRNSALSVGASVDASVYLFCCHKQSTSAVLRQHGIITGTRKHSNGQQERGAQSLLLPLTSTHSHSYSPSQASHVLVRKRRLSTPHTTSTLPLQLTTATTGRFASRAVFSPGRRRSLCPLVTLALAARGAGLCSATLRTGGSRRRWWNVRRSTNQKTAAKLAKLASCQNVGRSGVRQG